MENEELEYPKPEFVPDDQWWCPTCREVVPPEHVTYMENHDEREGGCGCPVI